SSHERLSTFTTATLPPTAPSRTICRRVPMSTWRVKGYVQDSDEEDENLEDLLPQSNREIQDASTPRVEHAQSTAEIAKKEGNNGRDGEEEGASLSGSAGNRNATPSQQDAPTRPTTSPITPLDDVPSPTPPIQSRTEERKCTESPDPIQASPSRRTPRNAKLPSSSLSLGAPLHTKAAVKHSVQSSGGPRTDNGRLAVFGLDEDLSTEDDLSDPPTDVEQYTPSKVIFASPKRRTEVQVVIPVSAALQNTVSQFTAAQLGAREEQRRRNFRERRPIQVHPYLLEGERYRQELQGRGIRPVARVVSPVRKTGNDDTETQDQQFEPEQDSNPINLLDVVVSTPVNRRPRKKRRVTSERQASSVPRTQIPIKKVTSAEWEKEKTNHNLTQPGPSRSRQHPSYGVWGTSPSPPHSSSPLTGNRTSVLPATISVPDVPTPPHLSSVQGDAQEADDSDDEPVNRGRRSTEQRRPGVTYVSDDQSLESELSSDSEPSEVELKKVVKRIKGVLPASWLRLDKTARDKSKAHIGAQLNDAGSPEKVGPQRGVAQRVTRKKSSAQRPIKPTDHSQEPVVISDDSEVEPAMTVQIAREVQQSAHAASDLAAVYDRLYADEDSEDMEDDRLDLFHQGGTSRKRKTQTKLPDAFVKVKKPRLSKGDAKLSSTSHAGAPGKTKHQRSRRAKHSPPPALSVLDFNPSPSGSQRNVPDFLKVAKRQARRRPDLGRQCPTNKHLRLHTARDTEDASTVLRQWKSGVLKPRLNMAYSHHRELLAHIDDNRQSSQVPFRLQEISVSGTLAQKQPASAHTPRERRRPKLPSGLMIFQRSSKALNKGTLASTEQSNRQDRSVQRKPMSYRAAQLEGLETNLRSNDRRFAFAKGLQQVDRQYSLQLPANQPSRNPQIARFLSGPDAVLPPLPTVEDVGYKGQETTARLLVLSKRRFTRKAKPQRIDVDAREYRQPSEPAAYDFLSRTSAQVSGTVVGPDSNQPLLQGLEPYGTRYPTDFDVWPLQSDTYFHASTFIGGEELLRALPKAVSEERNLDESIGYTVIKHDAATIKCGPWNDDTFAQISSLMVDLWLPLDGHASSEGDRLEDRNNVLQNTSTLLRSIIGYVATRLSFLDPIDRQSFVAKMKQLTETLLEKMFASDNDSVEQSTASASQLGLLRPLTYLLVLTMQLRQIAVHPITDRALGTGLTCLMQNIAKRLVTYLLQHISQLSDFLERNKRYAEREKGIQDTDGLVESLVVCMQVLAATNIPRVSFWDLVAEELASKAETATQMKTFESLWGTVFTLLPYVELDSRGIVHINGRMSLTNDSWTLIKILLKRLFALYPHTARTYSDSINDYVRATVTRCHVLIHYWHWHRCEPALHEIFDFFARNKFELLRGERGRGSAQFLEDLAGRPSLALNPNDNSFQIYLKCLALGLEGIRALPHMYPEKKIRSIVQRLVPNHGRSYPKDQDLVPESLDALRNHHDLLCTLYWASPQPCRPKLELIRGLVHHENSHREACKLNVRAWANLAAFQLSTAEPLDATRPFAEWHREMRLQTLKQYRSAKTEAEDYLKSGNLDTDASSSMVRQTMEKNQEQVIATLRDCITGMRKAVERSMEKAISKEVNLATIRKFLAASGLVQLLELLQFNDSRLVVVIRDTLGVLRTYAQLAQQVSSRRISQATSEESQDYGDSLDMDAFERVEQQCPDAQSDQLILTFIEDPLWRLLSNAFGAESAPDDGFLMECIDTWALISGCQVSAGARSWSHYLGPFSQVSWYQLRRTEQAQKFEPYYMAALISCDSAAYSGHEADFNTTLLSSLVERESMLRFQHRLLQAMVRIDPANPLLENLPFFRDDTTGQLDITAETLRTRRLALISSLLANVRDKFHATIRDSPHRIKEVQSEYAAMLKACMTAMKTNYQQLGQGSVVAGTYVEFVQRVVQFLQQYTSDICPVLKFFIDSVAFPLPATDPLYVVGHLCGYAPKLSKTGQPLQLSVFIETIAHQAAQGSQQIYLVEQLKTALRPGAAPTRDRIALRDCLLQGIFPAYIETAFTSISAFLIAMPVLQSLRSVLQTIMFDIRIFDQPSVRSAYSTAMSIAHAFIRSTERLKGNALLFKQPHVLRAVSLMLEAMAPVVTLLEYVCSRYMDASTKPKVVAYLEQLNIFIAEMLHDLVPRVIPSYMGNAHDMHGTHASLLALSSESLAVSIEKHWSTRGDSVVFGKGQAQRVVSVDIEGIEEEKGRLMSRIEAFHATVASVYGDDHDDGRWSMRASLGNLDV
ncbi:hypothetical protein CC80DRAFT_398411, partial [Byssothecium circinans]